MRERQHSRRNEEQEREAGALSQGGSPLEEIRKQAWDFLQAADEALDRLEFQRQNPEEILEAIRQEGGE